MTASSKVRKFKHAFTAPPTNPIPPPEIQASLFQVGMRVRKSVGQGYRTQLALEEAKIRRERAGTSVDNSNPRSIPAAFKDANAVGESLEDESFLSSSQDSITSVSSSGSASSVKAPQPTASKKRVHDFEAEEDDIDDLVLRDLMDTSSTCVRPIAQPRSRKLARPEKVPTNKQHQIAEDFGEADFLVDPNAETGRLEHKLGFNDFY